MLHNFVNVNPSFLFSVVSVVFVLGVATGFYIKLISEGFYIFFGFVLGYFLTFYFWIGINWGFVVAFVFLTISIAIAFIPALFALALR